MNSTGFLLKVTVLNLKMHKVKKITPIMELDKNEIKCLLFSKKWSGVTIF